MARGLASEVKLHLEKARDSALLAVETYNRPGTTFRSGGYIVFMCIAWTALLHAIFFRQKEKPFYRDKKNPRRYVYLDGDKKAWELGECLAQYYGAGSNPPERRNVEFFITIRNRIEHRSMPALDLRIFGECQALLFNFEDLLVKEFGDRYALNESLSLALQFSAVRNQSQEEAIRRLHRPLTQEIEQYINAFRSSLGFDVLNDLRFSYKVFLIPKVANHPQSDDLAVEFVKYDPTRPAQMDQYRKIATLIKASSVAVANQGRLLAGEVCDYVKTQIEALTGIKLAFNASYHHVKACYHYGIRTRKGKGDPRTTKAQYCQFDEAHGDYVYTEKWRDFLVQELLKPGKYDEILQDIGTSMKKPVAPAAAANQIPSGAPSASTTPPVAS